mgnify:CR=1 FL=1
MSGSRGRSPRSVRSSRPDRAVSITVNYVIALSITAVLISGLLVGASGYVESQRNGVVREELDVIGEGLAGGLGDADRLSRVDAESRTVRVGVDLPRRVAGESYRIEIDRIAAPGDDPGRYDLTLRSARSDVSVTLTVSTLVAVRERSVNGGPIVVRLDASGTEPELVVESRDSTGTASLDRPSTGDPTV